MDSGFFFKVWEVYHAHWGLEEQRILRKRHAAKLLNGRLRASSKMHSLYYMHQILAVMWEMDLFTRPNEVVLSIRDMADACLGLEDDESARAMDPVDRMRANKHVPLREECQDVLDRHWEVIHRPIMTPSLHYDDSIYRVSALVALF